VEGTGKGSVPVAAECEAPGKGKCLVPNNQKRAGGSISISISNSNSSTTISIGISISISGIIVTSTIIISYAIDEPGSVSPLSHRLWH